MVFPHVKEVEDIGLTNQPCKRSKICLVIPKGEAMTQLVLSASFGFLQGLYKPGFSIWFLFFLIKNLSSSKQKLVNIWHFRKKNQKICRDFKNLKNLSWQFCDTSVTFSKP
jgi:hypothetical protein